MTFVKPSKSREFGRKLVSIYCSLIPEFDNLTKSDFHSCRIKSSGSSTSELNYRSRFLSSFSSLQLSSYFCTSSCRQPLFIFLENTLFKSTWQVYPRLALIGSLNQKSAEGLDWDILLQLTLRSKFSKCGFGELELVLRAARRATLKT